METTLRSAERERYRSILIAQSELAVCRMRIAALRLQLQARTKANFHPGQLRIPAGRPDGGEWTDDPSLGVILIGGPPRGRPLRGPPRTGPRSAGGAAERTWESANPARRGRDAELDRSIEKDDEVRKETFAEGDGIYRRIGERVYNLTYEENAALRDAEGVRDAAFRAVRELDPTWRPQASLNAPTPWGEIVRLRSEPDETEIRLNALIGGPSGAVPPGFVPRGFANREAFEAFGDTLYRGFRGAGWTDVELYLRGSAVTGYRWRDGRPFDGPGAPSDFDIAVVSRELFQRAENLGFARNGRWTSGLRDDRLSTFDLEKLQRNLEIENNREIPFMFYRNREAVVGRNQPYIILERTPK